MGPPAELLRDFSGTIGLSSQEANALFLTIHRTKCRS
jgi:hypothetical protein